LGQLVAVRTRPHDHRRAWQDRTWPRHAGQDYILKQLTASLIYPEKDLGKKFWDKVYAKAQQQFGTTDIPVDTFNKVWIVADKAKVLEKNNAGYVVGAHLKVMLESDYMAASRHPARPGQDTRRAGEASAEGSPAPFGHKQNNAGGPSTRPDGLARMTFFLLLFLLLKNSQRKLFVRLCSPPSKPKSTPAPILPPPPDVLFDDPGLLVQAGAERRVVESGICK